MNLSVDPKCVEVNARRMRKKPRKEEVKGGASVVHTAFQVRRGVVFCIKGPLPERGQQKG